MGNPYVLCRHECVVNSDCNRDRACSRNRCVDPCPGACGVGAECHVSHHRPTCTCPAGMTGDPFSRCVVVDVVPAPDDPCSSSPCGYNAHCRRRGGGSYVCVCVGDYTGDPYAECRPQCVVNTDCGGDEVCRSHKCVDPCPGTCGKNAECRTINHSPACVCRRGYVGNAYDACRISTDDPSLERPDPCDPTPCGPFSTCRTASGGRPVCSCLPGHFGAPPECRPECVASPDCAKYLACVAGGCADPCPGSCGAAALCQVVNHSPVCSCPPGFGGDPYVQCLLSTTTRRPVVVATTPAPAQLCSCAHNAICTPIDAHEAECTCPDGLRGNPYVECRPECVVDSDCARDRACQRNACVDPCRGTCAARAECHVVMHRPTCLCPLGMTGDGYVSCFPTAVAAETTTRAPPAALGGDACDDVECGYLADCHLLGSGGAVCRCLPGHVGDPTTSCRPLCSADPDCPSGFSCVGGKCVDPCPGTCGLGAECRVPNHIPICTCPPGHSGSPYRRCFPKTEAGDPCDVCGPNSDCREVGNRPVCTCLPGFFGAPPDCRPECVVNRDCPLELACNRQKCQDPCPGACGANALCAVLNHSPVCTCLPGYTGEPFVRCKPIPTGVPPTSTAAPKEADPCRPGTCGTNAVCRVEGNRGVCSCLPGYYKNPYVECRPECVINSECPKYLACIGRRCQDPCPGTCGVGAVCEVVNHNPVCTCPRGMTGDPFSRCEPVRGPPDPCNPTPCGPYTDCRVSGLRAVCSCVDGYFGDPEGGCRPECAVSPDCPLSLACVGRRCVDPCVGVCGRGAECGVVGHNPLCTCPDGFGGDPLVACSPKPAVPADPCNPDPCGTNAACAVSSSSSQRPDCTCFPGYFGNPFVECRPECTINPDCPKYLACTGRRCRDPCPGACGRGALCEVVNHAPVCACPRGYGGDPRVSCAPAEVTTPRPECLVDDNCTDALACIDQKCQDPCVIYDNCAPNADCHVIRHRAVCSCPDGYVGDPNIQCLVAGCRSNSDCPVLQACINRDCDDPCEFENCGINAECRVVNQRAQCYCPEKFLGDPYVRCERPECISDPECPSWLACIDKECQDPCNCGPGAECRVINHRPLCTCPPGYLGDAYLECTPKPDEQPRECQTDGDCPSKLACFSGHCENPCLIIEPCGTNAKCSVIDTLPFRTMTCECLPDFIGNAYVECTPRPTEPPGCTSDEECGPTEVCRNRQCLDPCAVFNPCAPNAECEVINRQTKCSCPLGYTGNPNINCYLIPKEKPECRFDPDCSTNKACINEVCLDPCLVEDPCGREALCRTRQHRPTCYCPDGWAGNPQLECFKPECTKDDDCPADKACIGRNCVDPCTYGSPACGLEAECRAVLHSAKCHCPPGTQGNPSVACVAVGCTSSDDCAYDRACDHLNHVCVPVCEATTCAVRAQCHAANHAAMCACPPPLTGNPFLQCYQVQEPPVTEPPVEPECRRDSDCPSRNACINEMCQNPCQIGSPCLHSQECHVVDGEPFKTILCQCPPDHIMHKGGVCIKPGVIEPECHVDPDCETFEVCREGTCINVCRLSTCGLNAICSAVNHIQQCQCAEGYTGDPFDHCKRLPPLIQEPVPDCTSNGDCRYSEACVKQRCVNPCILDACDSNAFCYVQNHEPICRCPQGYVGDPMIECRPLTSPPESACSQDSECPQSLACLQKQCLDPCSCGENAVCRVVNHHAICSCAPGYDGDPYFACADRGCDFDESCPPTRECHDRKCTNPCHLRNPCAVSAECFPVNHEARCRCPSGFEGDPYEKCVALRCVGDRDCPKERTCRDGQCVDPCVYATCASSATCTPEDHRGVCQCPHGQGGDPTFRCDATEEPREPSCANDQDCATDLACVSGQCHDLCRSQICGDNALCRVVDSVPFRTMVCECLPGHQGDANTQCRPIPEEIGCARDTDCAFNLACFGGQCRDPCSCGVNALCTVVKHRPICECAPGYEGNPQISCSATGCTSNSQCPDDRACYNGNCASPCLLDNPCAPRAECQPLAHQATCFCPSGTEGDPLRQCLVVECSSDGECPPDRTCLKGRCLDQCIYNSTCAPNAQCRGIDHKAECRCPAGFEGAPTVACIEKQRLECRSDHDCEADYGCMDGTCQKPCQVLQPCKDQTVCTLVATRPLKTMTCTCPEHMVTSQEGECVDLETPISVGCRADNECPSDAACLNTRCVTPCNCGENAQCYVEDHRPICTCLPGYQGNPNVGCYKAGCSRDEECPLDKMCSNGVCVSPCLVNDPCDISAECYPETHQAKCRCPNGLEGDPLVRCRVIGCRSNSECPTDKACINRQCVDPCLYSDECAPNAECYVFGHAIGCRCPVDVPYGDPRFDCEEKTVEVEEPQPECRVDADCPSKRACIEEHCVNPCHSLNPCDDTALCDVVDSVPVRTMICICPEGFVITDDGTCELVEVQITPGCRADSECPEEEACINRMCRIPCDCGQNAGCEIAHHRPVCTCEVGFQGNPNIGCFPVGCRKDSDCEDHHACYDGICANPCLVNDPCAVSAECHAEEHRATCRCPSGLQGNGYSECLIVGCRSNSECPGDRACINAQCVDPCTHDDPCSQDAECVNLNHEARCRCPPGTAGDPRDRCVPVETPECTVDGDCPSRHACIDETCVNPCDELEPCHGTAECQVIDTLPVRTMLCVCPDGMVTEVGGTCDLLPPVKPVCAGDPDCPPDEACFQGHCKDPCQCGPNAVCEVVEHRPVCTCERGYEGRPEVRCYEIGCYGKEDCPTTHACRNGQCAPVCGPSDEPCGREAVCQGVDHEAVCYCPPGSRGNPHTQCIAIGCVSNDACPSDRGCINQRCVSPCALDPCEEPATCRVLDHKADCPCPPGFNRTFDDDCERIVIGCRSDGECPSQTACINGDCSDPCGLEPCGENTECRVVDTVPVRTMACECLPGFQGDAAEKCVETPVCPFEKGFVLDEDGRCICPADRGFYVDENGNCARCPIEVGFVMTEDGLCICDPEKGYVLTRAGTCECPSPAVKDDDGRCVVRTEPPIVAGCTSDEQCPTDKACDRGSCVPPCGFNPCATYATCISANHRAICTCISGYSGDPYQEAGCKIPSGRTDFPRPDMLVNCLADGIQVDINVGNPGFNGVMYVKGYSKNEECRRVLKPDVDVGTIDFKVKFNTCGLIHENGLARFILVLQKHPKLVTYKAQAYHVKCTYNTGEKTITIGFNVSMLTTAGTIANTGPPPTCVMRITNPNGDAIDKAEIGDLLMLQIQVDPSDIYGGFARSCIALTANSDGSDNEHLVTDGKGCATDASIFGEWEQDDDKALVALFSAFKFPSSNSIRFQCNVRVCFGRCHPTNCDGYDAFGKRRRRQAEPDAEVIYGDEASYAGQLREIQVSSQPIVTVEGRTERFTAPENPENVGGVEEVCVSKWGFIVALIITALLALVAVAVAVSCWLMAYRRRPKHGGPLPHPPEFPNPLFTTPEPLAEPSPDYLS